MRVVAGRDSKSSLLQRALCGTVALLVVLLASAAAQAAPPEAASPVPELVVPDEAVTATELDELDAAAASEPFLPAPERPIISWRDRFASGKDKVAVDVYQPAGKGTFPVVVLLHGARPTRADKHYQRIAESLAEHGYMSLYVHYYDRGRKGRGSRAQWGQAISDALTFASRLETADPSRVGVLGYSLGAFLALGKAPEDERVRAVVAYYGGISHGEPPDEARAMPPTLLLHGTADRVVPVRRSVQAFETLRQEGRPVDLVVYPGARHGFCLNGRGGADGQAAEDSWARALAFFSHYLREDAEAPSDPVDVRVAEEDTCPATDPLAVPPAYLTAAPAGVESSVALVNPDPTTVLSLVPQRAPRTRSHRTTRPAAPVAKPASVKTP